MVRHFRPRAYSAIVAATALTIVAAACTASSTSSPGQTTQALTPGWQGLNPGTGAPQYGGTLNMVGIGDVAVMDYDIGYYRTDFQVLRLTVRQLYSWPAIPGRTLTPAPDLAAGLPVVTTDIPEAVALQRVVPHGVFLSSTTQGFVDGVESALAAGAGPSRARSEAMSRESWDAKVEEIETTLMRL